MSGIGIPKVDARGRSGPRKTNGAMKIVGAFIPHGREMLESPAYRVLSLSARRVLARIEIEHMRHGGMDNGRLPVTFDDFAAYGIERHAIGPAIREVCALGFAVLTARGRSGNGDFRSPNKFRLTHIPTRGVKPTNDWDLVETEEEAKRIAKAARSPVRPMKAHSRAARVGMGSKIIESSGENPLANTVHSSGVSPLKVVIGSGKTPIGEWVKPTLAIQISQGNPRG